MIHKNINIQFPQFESKATMEKTHQDIYSEFLKKEIIVGEEVLEIHSRHSENRTLEQDITIVNNIIKKDGLVIIKTRDDDTGLSYFMLSRLGRLPEDCWKNLQTGNTKWSEYEKDNLHNIATQILKQNDRKVRIVSEPYLQRISRLIEGKWLNYEKKTDRLSLGPRFLGQMRRWLHSELPNIKCSFCQLVVMRGCFCDCKAIGYHESCFKKAHSTVNHRECSKCGAKAKFQSSKVPNHNQNKHQSQPTKQTQHQSQSKPSSGTKKTKVNGLIGLPNLGATCYMNSVIQILSNLPEITKIFLSSKHFQSDLADSYAQLMRQSWESPQTSASHHLLRKIIHTFPELQRGQQDPSEFLRCFLAELEKEVKEVKSTFSGWITHNTKCSNCQNESEQTNGFHDLSLAIPSSPKVTLEDCLQAQMKPREMSDVRCGKCQKVQNACQSTKLSLAPDTLCLQLQRFRSQNNVTKKILTEVTFPLVGLNIDHWSLEKNEKYSLVGVVCHHGEQVEAGHYTAFVYSEDKKSWYSCNDKNVSPVRVTEVTSKSTLSSSYMLFYRLRLEYQRLNDLYH